MNVIVLLYLEHLNDIICVTIFRTPQHPARRVCVSEVGESPGAFDALRAETNDRSHLPCWARGCLDWNLPSLLRPGSHRGRRTQRALPNIVGGRGRSLGRRGRGTKTMQLPASQAAAPHWWVWSISTGKAMLGGGANVCFRS